MEEVENRVVDNAEHGGKRYIHILSIDVNNCQCDYDNIELPCKLCSDKGFPCGAEDKIWGEKKMRRCKKDDSLLQEHGDYEGEDGQVIEVVPQYVIESHNRTHAQPIELGTQGYNNKPLDIQSQSAEADLLYDGTAKDSIVLPSSIKVRADNSSCTALEHRTKDSIIEQLNTTFASIQPRRLSTVEFSAHIYKNFKSWPMLDQLSRLRGTSHFAHDDLVPFFLSYHRQNINNGHYFWYWDHYRFFKDGLLELSNQSDPLRYAIAAFSALIYSFKVDHQMKTFTFFFYAKALQQLQEVINTVSMDSEASVYTTVATILELACIEVCPCIKRLMLA